jgi:N-acetylglucosamine kinase
MCFRFDLLDHCYTKFDKCHFAGLCKLLAEAAIEGDKLSQWLFSEAGSVLARHITALLPQVDHVSICRYSNSMNYYAMVNWLILVI